MRSFRSALLATLLISAAIAGLILLGTKEVGRDPAGKSGAAEEAKGQPSTNQLVAVNARRNEEAPVREPAAREALPETMFLPAEGAELVVQVRDSLGEPLPGVLVTLHSVGAEEELSTDPRGTTVFSGIRAGSYRVRLSGAALPELESATGVRLSPGERQHLNLVVGPFELGISGRVLDQSGYPVPGIRIHARKHLLLPRKSDLRLVRENAFAAESGPDGLYELRGLEPADYFLMTQETAQYPSARRVVRAGLSSADIILVTSRDVEIHGTVLTSEGAPLEGSLVVALGHQGASARADSVGAYSLHLSSSEQQRFFILKAARDGYRPAQVHVPVEDLDGTGRGLVDITLELLGEAAVVSGRMVDEDGLPVAGETIFLYSRAFKTRYQATSDQEGRFQVGKVPVAEDYRLWVHPRSRFKDFSRDPVAVGVAGLELEILLEQVATGTLRGVMLDPDGKQVVGFKLWVHSSEARDQWHSVSSDAVGGLGVEEIPSGDIVFDTRSQPKLTVRGIHLEPGDTREVTLVLDWGEHSLSGTVVNEEGEAVVGAKVSLYWQQQSADFESSSLRASVSDAAGRFAFSRLGSGMHKISVAAAGYRGAEASYAVGSGTAGPLIRLHRKPESR